MLKDYRTCDTIKRVYISFQLEPTDTVSQLKYECTTIVSKGIFDTLREHSAFLKMNELQSYTDAIIGVFLGINPKLTIRKVLRGKIDELYT